MQKLLLFLVLLSQITLANDPYTRNPNIDIKHYRFEIELNDASNIIVGRAEVTVLFHTHIPQFELDLIGKSTGESGMEVSKVLHKKNPIAFKHQNNKLSIFTPSTIQPDDTATFEILYKGVPEDGLVISRNKFGDRTFFGDNWPNRARYWLPTIDHPYDKASCEFVVTAPSHYQVIGNGVKVEQSTLSGSRTLTHWKEDIDIPTKVMVIGVAHFATTISGYVDTIPVETWVYPQNKEAGFLDFKVASNVLDYFNDQIGPYPYKKLANVQSTTRYGGMENASNIFYFENSVTGNNEREGLIAHEIAHQWFGDSASEADWYHVWLSEGFATYFTNLYFEHTYGRDRLIEEMKTQRNEVTAYFKQNPAPVIDTTLVNINRVLNTNSYQKGGWVLHMLRHEVGDEAFWNGIRTYYKTYRNGNALTGDFRMEMERTSGKDLKDFFTQWLRQSGHPVLDASWGYNAKKKTVDLNLTQRQSSIFAITLEIGLKMPDGSIKVEPIHLDKKEGTYALKVDNRPSEVILDPNVWLLYEGEIRQK